MDGDGGRADERDVEAEAQELLTPLFDERGLLGAHLDALGEEEALLGDAAFAKCLAEGVIA